MQFILVRVAVDPEARKTPWMGRIAVQRKPFAIICWDVVSEKETDKQGCVSR